MSEYLLPRSILIVAGLKEDFPISSQQNHNNIFSTFLVSHFILTSASFLVNL